MTNPQPESKWHLIAQRLQERIGGFPTCSCGSGSSEHELIDGFILQPLEDDPTALSLGGRGLSLVALLCKRCGKVTYYNLITLGLADEFGIIPNKPASEQNDGQ